ncbi:hypothetical protein BH23ACT5_BH23ACT5_06690 [soil metagenome]
MVGMSTPSRSGAGEDAGERLHALASLMEPLRKQLLESFAPLVEHANRQIAERLAPLREQMVASIVDSPGFQELLRRFREALPPNWSEAERASRIAEFSSNTAICLVWVPRPETIRALLESAEPFESLMDHAGETLEDIDGCLAEVKLPELDELRQFAMKAREAYNDHPEAAQALAASTLTTVIHNHLGREHLADARSDFSDWENAPYWQVRIALVGLAVAKALEPNYPQLGDPSPTTFNRHTATHGVSLSQYNRAHSLSALMALAGLLRELQELQTSEGAVTKSEDPPDLLPEGSTGP